MSKSKSADLLIKLYDLRREPVMREARNFWFTFNPKSAEEYSQAMMDPETGGLVRMVASYWDMAASFVNHGAIDSDMFNDANGEHMLVFAKIEPLLSEMRTMFESPEMFKHLEKVIMDAPNGREKLTKTQEWLASLGDQSSEASA